MILQAEIQIPSLVNFAALCKNEPSAFALPAAHFSIQPFEALSIVNINGGRRKRILSTHGLNQSHVMIVSKQGVDRL
jgi:hypothetical protein